MPPLQQAMFLSNSPLLDAAPLEPGGDNLAAKLMAESDLSLRVRHAYEHVLGRWPDEAESQSCGGLSPAARSSDLKKD